MDKEFKEKINREMDEFVIQSIEKFEHDVSITLNERDKSNFKVGFMYGVRFGIAHKKE